MAGIFPFIRRCWPCSFSFLIEDEGLIMRAFPIVADKYRTSPVVFGITLASFSVE